MMRLFSAAIGSLALALATGLTSKPVTAQPVSTAASEAEEPILLPLEIRPQPIVTQHHLDIENYADGAVKIRREINMLSDQSAVNHGQFIEFYKNGEKFSEGRYKNGMQDGDWTYWFENGKVCKTVQFKDGVPDGRWSVYRQDGTLRATREYVNGRPHGKWIVYGDDGETAIEERQYERGLAHGQWIQRYPSGKPHIEETHQQGKRHGKYVERDEQGQVVREMGFKEGQLDGRAVIRARGGTEIIQYYRDGQLVPDGPEAGGQ